MQWSLFLLILVGQSHFFTCQLYEYHFIREHKSWYEAQKYCRENYTDLAVVFDMADMRRLQQSSQNQSEAWIGLYNNTGGNRTWHWALPGVEYIHNQSSWNQGEPNDGCGTNPENCVLITDKWADYPCSYSSWFVCCDETNKDNKTLYLVKETMTWSQAQNYCRQHHTDLASGYDQVEGEEMMKLKISENITKDNHLWIGLFRDRWRWSDGSGFSFRFWDMELFTDKQSTNTCAVTLLDRSGRWSSDDCNQTKPFFCYEDKVILIKENKTWEDALNYCRVNHTDLVSITSARVQAWVKKRAADASTPYVWLGLRYSCTLDLWFWVSDQQVCYDNWAAGAKTERCDMTGAMKTSGEHIYEWSSQSEYQTFNFICSTE